MSNNPLQFAIIDSPVLRENQVFLFQAYRQRCVEQKQYGESLTTEMVKLVSGEEINRLEWLKKVDSEIGEIDKRLSLLS